MDNLEPTVPTPIHDTQPIAPPAPPRKPRRGLWVLGGIVLVILTTVVGGLLGYGTAVQARKAKQASQVALIATTQFQLGVEDLNAGRLENAQRRFEYVISMDPKFPGAQEKLTEVMMAVAMVKTPTPEITPTISMTPTPDNRGAEELYAQAMQFIQNKEWENAINTLDALRKEDIRYRAVDVDGLYYIALRFRGVDKIIAQGNLEGGMYDLALTENFGPIDKEADSYRNWARFYMSGASFWEIDWVKVLEYFGQIYPSLPNLRDGSGWTAVERFRIASIRYGDQLLAKGEYCMARDQYLNALSISQDNNLGPTATAVQLLCSPPTSTPQPPTKTPEVMETTPVTPETPPDPTEETPEAPTATTEGGV